MLFTCSEYHLNGISGIAVAVAAVAVAAVGILTFLSHVAWLVRQKHRKGRH